ncbi:MAG: M14 family metallopeptidase [Candidatus Aminicenantaceae bacterium]
MKQTKWLVLTGILFFIFPSWTAQSQFNFDRYHTPAELNEALKNFAASNPKITVLHKIAVTPGQKTVNMIEIGSEVKRTNKTLPAVLVAANMEGTAPLSSEAAMYLVQLILEKPEVRKDKTWYILPLGNPDAAARYFSKPLTADARNSRPYNDDMDDRIDEDGVEDLNGDGFITKMRVKDPQGVWIPVPGDSRMLKKADWAKGEKGVYKLYTEGLDNDGDGEYNEDGPGGVNIGINFPHLFQFFTKTAGTWAGSESESRNLIKFITEHREIAITFTFGAANFCLTPPKGGRQASADLSKIKIPKRFAGFLNADPDKTYTIKEVMEMVQPFVPEGMEVTEAMISSFLGLGAVVNPLAEDLKFYKELSEKYKEFLKKNKLDAKRLETPGAKDGSFELWSYYHLGVPSFAMDFWTLPEAKEEKKDEAALTPEKLEKMTDEEFIALGEDKITELLKSAGAPPNFKAKMVIDLVKDGKMTTKKMAEMMKQMPKPESKEGGDPEEKALLAFSDKELDGKGFVKWKPYKHPALGEVEIGGAVPYTSNTPPAKMMKKLVKGQVPWVFELAGKMARIKISKTEVKPLGGRLFRIKAWIENTGYLPYPTAMGKRNTRILPVIVTVEGANFNIVEGKKRSLVKSIGGNQTQIVTWIIQAEKPVKLNIKATTNIAWNDSKQVELGGSR